MGEHNVQGIGQFTATIIHPSLLAGAAVGLKGFKIEGVFLDGEPIMDNSKIVALINGDTITLTNTVRAGVLTWTAAPTSLDPAQGDVLAVSQAIQGAGDNQGGILQITFGLNGQTFRMQFLAVTMKKVPSIKLAGNDVPDLSIEWHYGDFQTS